MATEVGSAFVSIVPSTRGFGRSLNGQIGNVGTDAGRKTGSRFGTAFAAAGGAGIARGGLVGAIGGLAAASGIGAAISKAGDFDKTMRTVGATTGEAGAGLKNLTALALDMGAKTTFSAQGAADAMLELSKGGLSAAQIKAGALRDTLLLASAGGLELGSAAGFMVQGMTTFGLAADQGGQVASALAGAANASTASVESIGQALSQVGPGAKNAGLTIQETTAALAAFDNAGIKGSDAGTSLKTMLTALVPSTKAAATAMSNLGLDFTNQDGSFVSLSEVAGQLQDKLGGLSQEAKTTALKDIAGSDASRAASVLADTGSAGIDKLVAATSDAGAAARMAKVGTQGYAGALEAFQGSVETAQIQLGTKFLPVATRVLNFLTNTMMPGMQKVSKVVTDALGGAFNAAKKFLGGVAADPAVQAMLVKLGATAVRLRATFVRTFGQAKAMFGPATAAAGAFGASMQARIVPAVVAVGTFLARLGQSVVTGVVPAFRQIGTFITAYAIPGLRNLMIVGAQLLPQLVTPLKAVALVAGAAIVVAFRTLGTLLTSVVGPAFLAVTTFIKNNQTTVTALAVSIGTFVAILKIAALTQKAWLAITVATTAAMTAARVAVIAFNVALRANPIGLVITALIALAAGLVYAYKHSETFRTIVNNAWNTLKIGALAMVPVVIGALKVLTFGFLTTADAILSGAAKAFGWVPGIGEKLKGANTAFDGFRAKAMTNLDAISAKAKSTQTDLLQTGTPGAVRPGVPAPRGPVSRTLAAQEAAQAARGPRVAAQYNGPITVRANDPAQIERQLAMRRRQLALGV